MKKELREKQFLALSSPEGARLAQIPQHDLVNTQLQICSRLSKPCYLLALILRCESTLSNSFSESSALIKMGTFSIPVAI